jgi:hypothetical protein
VQRFLRALDAFWFVEGSSTRLAALRIIVGVGACFYVTQRFDIFSDIAASPANVFEPAGVVALLRAPIPARLFVVLMVCTLLANLAFIVGWRFRRTGPLFAGLLLWLLCYRNSWSMIYHSDNLMVLHVIILGMTRSADALSVDALSVDTLRGWSITGVIRRLLGRARPPASPTVPGLSWFRPAWHWEYGYPIMLLCAVTAVTYLLSGIAKVAGESGWGWALGDGLRSQVAFDGLRKELISDSASPLAFVLFNNVGLATLFGVGTLVIELGAPLALLDVRLGRVWALAAFSMHWGIFAIMGIVFWYHLLGIAFAPFLVDERVVAWALAIAERMARALTARRWWHAPGASQRRRDVAASPAGVTSVRPLPDPG